MIRTLLAFILGMACIIFTNAGLDWLNIGHGLHPLLAFPLATVCFLAVVLMMYISIQLHNEQQELEAKAFNLEQKYKHR